MSRGLGDVYKRQVDIPPETNGLPEDGAEIAENVMSDADAMEKETTE